MGSINKHLAFLFLLPTLIWGSTWLAITWQLGRIDPEVSVFYRFVLSTLLIFIWALWKKARLRFSPRQHLSFALQGLCMFCMNYILTYYSEKWLTSGLVAVTFTLLLYFNMAGLRLYFRERLDSSTLWGALVGGLGILLLFHKEILSYQMSQESLMGLGVGVVATVFASVGNMAATYHSKKKLSVLSFTPWSMLYGTLWTLLIMLVLGRSFVVLEGPSYWLSLIYLSLFGTVIAFAAYLKLIEILGPAKAAYTSVLNPILALMLSAIFEKLIFDAYMILGVALSLLGNVIILAKRGQAGPLPKAA